MAKTKLDSEAILKSLPEGFIGVQVPNRTRVVYMSSDNSQISPDNAKKAVKKVAKELGLSVSSMKKYTDDTHFCLEDKEFNKQMRDEAKACLKAITSFYSKYDVAYRYDDTTCDIISKVMRTVNQ